MGARKAGGVSRNGAPHKPALCNVGMTVDPRRLQILLDVERTGPFKPLPAPGGGLARCDSAS